MNKKDKETKNLKRKEYINKFKEAWANPTKKAGIKLLSYFIFFLIFLLIASLGTNNNTNKPIKTTTTTTTIKKETFTEKQKRLVENNHNINFKIKIKDKEYTLEGILKDNIIEGYLTDINGIKKIIIKENNIYEIKNDTETLLQTEIDINKITITYIIDLIKNNSAYINNTDDITTYQYSININEIENVITVYTNDKNIYKITIVEENNEYILDFDNKLSE